MNKLFGSVGLAVMIMIMAMLFPTLLMAQEAGEPDAIANPGCTVSWESKMFTESDGSTVEVWEKEGDLAGFNLVVNENAQLVEKEAREISCEQAGIMNPGTYDISISPLDTSGNEGEPASMRVAIVELDTSPPTKAKRVCLGGTLQGKPVKICQEAG